MSLAATILLFSRGKFKLLIITEEKINFDGNILPNVKLAMVTESKIII